MMCLENGLGGACSSIPGRVRAGVRGVVADAAAAGEAAEEGAADRIPQMVTALRLACRHLQTLVVLLISSRAIGTFAHDEN
jgi:microcompartment protein CcmL/EutN